MMEFEKELSGARQTIMQRRKKRELLWKKSLERLFILIVGAVVVGVPVLVWWMG